MKVQAPPAVAPAEVQTTSPYLPALDGLRALAVMAVLAYHLDLGWARGGFLGVDLFFVISGYLITTLLLSERDGTGRIDLPAFWSRRFRRLVPALALVVSVVILAFRLLGVPEQWQQVRGDAMASLAYVANWRFIFNHQSYFQSALPPSPLRHMWSLAVEEQWYILWPIVLALALSFGRARRRILAGVLLLALGSAVLTAAVYSPSDPSRAYYGTDTRAQNLLVGSALALALWALPHRSAGWRRLAAGPGLLALLIFAGAMLWVDSEASWLYHGGFLALSAVFAVVVLAVSDPGLSRPLAGLGARPLRWIGQRSYGIYLWHFPVIILLGAAETGLRGWTLRGFQVVVTFGLAAVSYTIVERPARRARRPALVVAGWCAIVAWTMLAAVLVLRPGAQSNLLALADGGIPRLAQLNQERVPGPRPGSSVAEAPSVGGSVETAPSTAVAPTTPPSRPRLLLVGDSTAFVLAMNFPAQEMSDAVEASSFTGLGCGVTPGVPLDGKKASRPPDSCLTWQADWRHAVDETRPDLALIMVGPWEIMDHQIDGRSVRYGTPEWDAAVRQGIEQAVAAVSAGEAVALMNVPCMQQRADAGASLQARNEPERQAALNEIIQQVAAERGAKVLDLRGLLCPSGEFAEQFDGVEMRFDGVHLTPEGAAVVWRWLVRQVGQVLPAG